MRRQTGRHLLVSVCGSVVLTLSLGVRHGFGLFLKPMTMAWAGGRESFAFALALQNLVWGATQPFVGMLADCYGAARTIAAGAVLYALGRVAMAHASSPLLLSLGTGVVIGVGLSCTTFSVVAGALGRAYPPQNRSMALGISGAAGSFGQFAMLPFSEVLIAAFGWHNALLLLAATSLLMLPLGLGLAQRGQMGHAGHASTPARVALLEAFGSRDFWLLCFGFFVCGFQVIFIAIHLPAYLQDLGLGARAGVTALALIGLYNIFGSHLAGYWGTHYRKPLLLGVAALLINLPICEQPVAALAPQRG